MSSVKAPRASSDRPGFLSFPLVMAVFALLLAGGLALGLYIHERYVSFERVVAHHVPSDAAFAVRWDVEKVTLFEPTRRYLLPLFDASAGVELEHGDGRPRDGSRRQRLTKEIGLDIGRDLREVLALVGPREGDWALVLGGSFPKTGVPGAVERVLRSEGLGVRRLADDRFAAADAFAFGRAADGVLVMASSPERLDAALTVRSPNAAIPRTGAGAVLLRADAPGLSQDVRAALGELGDVSHVEGSATFGSPLVVDLTVAYRGRAPDDALPRARRVVAELMGPGAVPPTEILSAESDRVVFRIRFSDEALERAAQRAGDSVYGTLWGNRVKSATP